MNYHIHFKRSVFKDTKQFPQAVILRIQKITHQLSQDPYPPQSQKMKGFPHTYRYRFSQYRLIYEVDKPKKVIIILKVGHRKHIYRSLT